MWNLTTLSLMEMTITGTSLIRATGLAAIMAGIIFAAIQPIHPADVVASVTNVFYTLIMVLKLVMCFLFLFATVGLCARLGLSAGPCRRERRKQG